MASSLQSEAGNSQITIGGEVEVVIKNGGQEPKKRGGRVLRLRHTGLEWSRLRANKRGKEALNTWAHTYRYFYQPWLCK